jgi:OTU domain-containing protein 6
LQSKIQALKKNATKGDRKKKKEIDEEIQNLEREFERKCCSELESLKQNQIFPDNENLISEKNVCVGNLSEEKYKINKAERRREKKEIANIEREKQIELQEIENKKGSAFIELNNIREKLKPRNLKIKEVRSDGNCMYYSIADQLNRVFSINKTCQELREIACNYMLENRIEFEPYLELDNTVNTYEEYCQNIKDQTVWGGQLELKALSDVLNVLIEVIQSEGSEIIIGDQSKASGSLIITYHRKMFGSGEHYNSTSDIDNLHDTQ